MSEPLFLRKEAVLAYHEQPVLATKCEELNQSLVGVLIRERLVAGIAFSTASFCIVWLDLRGETLHWADPEKIWEAIGSSLFPATGYAWLIWQAFFHARKGTVVLSCFAALLSGAVLFSLWAR